MKQLSNRKNKQQGYTIVEILIGVIVAAIVVAGIYVGWNSFYTSNQASTIQSEMNQIIQNTETLYANSTDGYTSVDTASAITAGVFPSSLKIKGTTVTNSYSGAVTLTSVAESAFSVTYASIPADVCTKVLSSFVGANNVVSLTVGSTSVTDVKTVAAACASGSSMTVTAK